MIDQPRRPYSPTTLAERWDCSAQHVRNLIRGGKLHAFYLGELVRVTADEVDRFEREQAATPADGKSPYTIEELSDRWSCSVGTVRKLIREGRLRSYRIGKLIRVAAAEVERFEAG